MKFEITIAVNSGYNHNNEIDLTVYEIGRIWQKIQEEEDIYLSANIVKQVTCYSEKFGCPAGGENSFLISGIQNKQYDPCIIDWTSKVTKLAARLKEMFNQTRVYIVFYDVEVCVIE